MEDSGWIPVSERVPKNTDSVLVTDGSFSCTVAWYNGAYWEAQTDMLVAENYDGYATIAIDVDITHWQPLPAPPNNSWDKISEIWEIGKND